MLYLLILIIHSFTYYIFCFSSTTIATPPHLNHTAPGHHDLYRQQQPDRLHVKHNHPRPASADQHKIVYKVNYREKENLEG